ncbi:hypothetical protein [Streptomyces sp. NPDC048392]|uniref:hypothetical protein n=1 Tax=Streptomyces sp. NPDC048392 TaxID=3365543 RepID=UPI0037180CD3
MTPPDAPTSVPAGGSSAGPRTNPVADVLASVMGYFSNRDDMAPQNEIVTFVTAAYLDQLDPTDPPTPRVLEKELLAIVGGVIKAENFKAAVAAERYPLPRYLTYWQVAQILLRPHHVIRIAPNAKDTDREYDLLAMYQATSRARDIHHQRGRHPHHGSHVQHPADTQGVRRGSGRFARGQPAPAPEHEPRLHRCAQRHRLLRHRTAGRHDLRQGLPL